MHRDVVLTLLWLPPPKYCVWGFGCRWQLNGHHLGLQKGTKVQLPQELPLDTIIGRELNNDTYNHRKKSFTWEEEFHSHMKY